MTKVAYVKVGQEVYPTNDESGRRERERVLPGLESLVGRDMLGEA